MKVITLTGPSHSGKTTTLKHLYTHLISVGAKDIIPPQKCPRSGGDDEYYVLYKGEKIAIVTIGDYAIETVFYIGINYGRGADTLIIANSNKGYPYTIADWHSDIITHVDIKKNDIYEQGKVQEIMIHIET